MVIDSELVSSPFIFCDIPVRDSFSGFLKDRYVFMEYDFVFLSRDSVKPFLAFIKYCNVKFGIKMSVKMDMINPVNGVLSISDEEYKILKSGALIDVVDMFSLYIQVVSINGVKV